MSASLEQIGRTLAGYWPKFDPTPEQSVAIAGAFRGLDDEQVQAVCGFVYASQSSARREPNVAMLGKQAHRARNEHREERRAVVKTNATGNEPSSWLTGMIQLRALNKAEGMNIPDFVVAYWSGDYSRKLEFYTNQGLPRLECAIWWLRMQRSGVCHDLEQSGFSADQIEAAVANMVGVEYPAAVGELAKMRKARKSNVVRTTAGPTTTV